MSKGKKEVVQIRTVHLKRVDRQYERSLRCNRDNNSNLKLVA